MREPTEAELRVAKALHERMDVKLFEARMTPRRQKWDAAAAETKSEYLSQARAAIRAMSVEYDDPICESLKWRFDNDDTYGSSGQVSYLIDDFISLASPEEN